jgi:hypothetical protein
MKRLLFLLAALGAVLLIFGCGETPNVTDPIDLDALGTLVQRPQYIETRPPDVVEQYIMSPSPDYLAYKKPPKPPPDTGTEDPNPNPPHKYAYVVGISDYEGTINDLQYCDDDAREMKQMLQGEGFTIRIDLDRSATADAIVEGLNWLVSSAQPGDEIAFCYSGHGAKAPGYGSSIISTDLYYITHGYVMQIFNSVDCSKKLAAMDACVLGDFHSDCQPGTMMATASRNSDSYDAPDLQNGAWTYYFLEGVNSADLIYAEDVAAYAEDGMKAWAKPYRLRVSPIHTDKYTGMFDI